MNLRTFFLSLTAIAVKPWKLLGKTPTPKEVFPTSTHALIGITVVDPIKPNINRFVVVGECPSEFEWQGQQLRNYRGTLFFGHRVGHNGLTLLCIERWHLYPQACKEGDYRLRFFEE